MPVNWLTDKIKNSPVVNDTVLYAHKETRQALVFKWTTPQKQQQQHQIPWSIYLSVLLLL